MSLQRGRKRERLKRDFRLLKEKRIPEVLSIFWAVKRPEMINSVFCFCFLNRLIISIKYYKCILCCLTKAQIDFFVPVCMWDQRGSKHPPPSEVF